MLRTLLNHLATRLAIRFRFPRFFQIIKYLNQRTFLSRYTSKLIDFYDPNNLRRKTNKTLSKSRVIETGIYGEKFLLDLSEHVEYQAFFRGCFDRVVPDIIKSFAGNLRVDFIDIGANIGLISLAAAKLGAEVNAFEPLPRNIQIFNTNFSLNSGLRARIWPVALTSNSAVQDSSLMKIYSPEGNAGATSSNRTWNIGKKVPVEVIVEIKTLDECVFEFLLLKKMDITIIKIDVEGMEYSVLNGATQVLDNFSPIVILEWRPDKLSEVERSQLMKLLASRNNYEVLEVVYDISRSTLVWSDVDWQKSSENLAFFPTSLKDTLVGNLVPPLSEL